MPRRLALAALALFGGSTWLFTSIDAPVVEVTGGRRGAGETARAAEVSAKLAALSSAAGTAQALERVAAPTVSVAPRLSGKAQGPSGALRITWDAAVDGRGRSLPPDSVAVARVAGGPVADLGQVRVDGDTPEVLVSDVGLACKFMVATSSVRVPGEIGAIVVDGPTEAGQTVDVHVPLRPRALDLVTVTATLVDGASEPYAGREVTLSFVPPAGQKRFPQRYLTDGVGGVTLEVPRLFLRVPLRIESWRDDALAEVEVAPPALDPRQGLVDLGEIVLVPPEPILPVHVSGRILPDSGPPYPGWALEVALFHAEGADLPGYVVTSRHADDEGRFSLDWKPRSPVGTLRLKVSSPFAIEPVTVDVLPNTRDLEIVLPRGLTVSARVLADPWIAESFRSSVTLVGDGLDQRRTLRIGSDGVGALLLRGCPPGRGRLTVKLGKGDWALFDQEIAVYGDVDLGEIDLRDALRACHLRLHDGSGQAIRGSVEVRATRDGTRIDTHEVSPLGHVDLLVPTRTGALELVASGGVQGAVTETGAMEIFTRNACSGTVPPEHCANPVNGEEVRRFDLQLGP